jgi:fumarate reductase iron-sulfur subunit
VYQCFLRHRILKCREIPDKGGQLTTHQDQRQLTVHIWRGAEAGAWQTWQVPARDSQTVLDVVTWIQRHRDPDLSYRYACRVGMCGTCAMTVQGKPRWTCRTRIGTVVKNSELTIGPLRNLPVIKDLATDMAPFFDKWSEAGAQFVPKKQSPDTQDKMAAVKPDNRSRRAADLAIECIGCAVCYAACDTVAWRADYLGPAALNRVWTLVNDERDADPGSHLGKVADERGCLSCHSHQSCAELCPKHLNPTASIAGLKRKSFLMTLAGRS